MTAEPAVDMRRSPRSNMFIAAALQGEDFSSPVKVRNMSVTGALAEGPTMPRSGAQVRLVRGSLSASARVAWSAQGRCGLHFSSLVCVRDWLAPPANVAQRQVDEVVGLLKLGALPMPKRRTTPADASGGDRQLLYGEDLRRASRLIELLSDELAGDERVVERHLAALQSLDIVIQTVSAVADGLAESADGQAVARRLENLRASCVQALGQQGEPGVGGD